MAFLVGGVWQTPAVVDDKGGLEARALVAAEGGVWSGLLFDNPVVGVPPALTWTISVPLEPVDGEKAALDLDWLPLAAAGWQSMAGLEVRCLSFAEPAESSVCLLSHHRYDRVAVRVAEQRGALIRVVATVGGDIDGWGPEEFSVDSWVSFEGVVVQLSGVSSAEAALARLGGFLDTSGLIEVGDPRGIAFRFAPR